MDVSGTETGGAAGGEGTTAATGGAGADVGGTGAGASGSEVAGATGRVGATPAGGQGEAGGAGAVVAAEKPAYTPNYKYRVLKEEKELPEWVRPVVTTPEVEKQLRDVFERADGIEAVKTHRDQLVQENEAMRTEWAPTIKAAQTAVAHLQRGDLDSFFESVNIPEQAILKYALYRLQLRENPAQLQAHERVRALQNEKLQLQQQLEQSQSGYQEVAAKTLEMQLEAQLTRAETLPAVQAFDARVGTPGAFQMEVIRRGKMNPQLTPAEAVSEVLQLIGWTGQSSSTGTQGVALAPQAGGTAGRQGEAKPTFPSIRGKGTSPAKKVIRSTDQLRELARQKA